MNQNGKTMRAIALNRFGGPDVLELQTLPVPEIGSGEVLIRVEFAGVGEWDPFEREGGYAEAAGIEPSFPYVLGSEGAGTIAAVGDQVSRFKVGDPVYAPAFLNPKGGFYAEYAAVDAENVSLVPIHLTVQQAGVMSGVGITALRGLDDVLNLQPGERVMIFGASGGIGHLAVQLAKQMGAHVFAVASGEDGVALVEGLGSDVVVDGRNDDLLAAIQRFAPEGLDAALLTAGGEAAEKALEGLRAGGRVAYPNGIQPEPQSREGIQFTAYNGEPDPEIIRKFSGLVEAGGLSVHIARTFPLENAAEAHRALDEHYVGKFSLGIDG